ncbi:MAG: hypothetical protein ACREDQ_02950 [Limisphaerales bacterium]
MKIITQLSAALLALGIVSQAGADPVVYLTGSTAFRSTVMTAILNNGGTNTGGVFDAGTVTYVAYGNSSATSGNFIAVHGMISGSPVYLDCAWSGSEAGIASACNTALQNQDRDGNSIPLAGSPETWLNVSNVTLNGAAISTNPGPSLLESSSHGADLAQSDTSQAISWTPFVANTSTALKDYGVEGIVTFTITRNNQSGNSGSGTPTGASNEWVNCGNITLPQINTLLSLGEVPAGFISGNTNDNDFSVYCVGRNLGSGTRMNALGDSAYGAHRAVQQYSIGYGVEETPHQNSLILTNEGNNGYESGGDVGKALGILGSCQQADPFNSGTGWFALGYIGPSDALNTGNFGGEPTNCWVTVDGVPSNNGTIENGQWWYWGHEHLLGKYQIAGTALTMGNQLVQATALTLQSLNYGATSGGHDPAILSSYMHVHKNGDTGFPLPGQ